MCLRWIRKNTTTLRGTVGSEGMVPATDAMNMSLEGCPDSIVMSY